MKKVLLVLIVIVIGMLVVACSSKPSTSGQAVIKTVDVGNLKASLSNATGQLKQGEQELTLSFTDAAGKPVDVGAVSLNLHMPSMGAMAAMNDAVALTTTETPGVYRGKVNVSMAGEWQAQLAYEGGAGTGKTTFSVTAR